jgi:hypothetical protein
MGATSLAWRGVHHCHAIMMVGDPQWIMRSSRLLATQIVSATCGDWPAGLQLRMRSGRSALYHSSAALL